MFIVYYFSRTAKSQPIDGQFVTRHDISAHDLSGIRTTGRHPGSPEIFAF